MEFRVVLSRTLYEERKIHTSAGAIRRRLFELMKAAEPFGFTVDQITAVDPASGMETTINVVWDDSEAREAILETDVAFFDTQGNAALLRHCGLPGETPEPVDDTIAF